jgi:hypothetical protein
MGDVKVYIELPEASARVGVSICTLRRWINRGKRGMKLPAKFSNDGKLLIAVDELDAFCDPQNCPVLKWRDLPIPPAPAHESREDTEALDWRAVCASRLERNSQHSSHGDSQPSKDAVPFKSPY